VAASTFHSHLSKEIELATTDPNATAFIRDMNSQAEASKNEPPPRKGEHAVGLIVRILAAAAGVLAAFGSVWWAIHDTPPNRAANEKAFIDSQTEAEKTAQAKWAAKREREITRQKEIEARLSPQVSRPTTPVPLASSSCFFPAPGATLYWKPLRLSAGSCVELPPQSSMYFWAVFDAVPEKMEGVAEIKAVKDIGNKTPEGNPIPEPTGEVCAGNCNAFLSQNLGKAVFVRQAPGQSLQLKL
jgi:hypothetical protein